MIIKLLAILLVGYLVWYDLILPITNWIESKIPYGYEDEEGFHYGKPE